MSADDTRIAMWSGPRNISTALMRSWGSRADTAVADEPYYAAWLARTGAPHPGREEILAAQETDPDRVAAWISGPIPGGCAIWYQKHMAHHLLPSFRGTWMRGFRHALLVREPRSMLASLSRVLPDPSLADTGLPQQLDLLRTLREETASVPPIVDAAEVLADPGAALRRLCRALRVPFDGAMLHWKPGPRETDGVWAKHWYASVEASSGFRPALGEPARLPARLEPLARECGTMYAEILAAREPEA